MKALEFVGLAARRSCGLFRGLGLRVLGFRAYRVSGLEVVEH